MQSVVYRKWNEKRKMKRLLAICMTMVCVAVLLSGCGSEGEKGLFDEVSYSEDAAKEVYQKVSGQLENFLRAECAYVVDASTITTQYNYFWTEEYTLAFAEDEEQRVCLWYEGKYYAEKDGKVTYTELPWEELHTEQMRKQAQELAVELLTRSYDSITFEKIPRAGENRYLLSIEYPLSVIPQEEKEVYPTLYIWVDEDETVEECIVKWSVPLEVTEEGLGRGGGSVSTSLYPYEGSTDKLAERRIALFLREAGLEENEFSKLSDIAKRDDSLQFPTYEKGVR